MPNILIEVCSNSVASAVAAQEGGALRVELCDNMREGGTTPSIGAVSVAREKLNIDLNVIIRPRGGDFLYSDMEFEMMRRDIAACKDAGANGVVTGLLNADGSVDCERVKQLVDEARPMSVTFHRAFDVSSDPFKALEDCKRLSVNRILTSGCKNKSIDGADLLAQLVKKAGGDITIMPGSGVNENTIADLIKITKAREYHISARITQESAMRFRADGVSMGDDPNVSEFSISQTDPAKVRTIVEIAKQAEI